MSLRSLQLNLILVAVRDSSLRKIVRGHLDVHHITRHKADIVFTHFSANVRDDAQAILELNLN